MSRTKKGSKAPGYEPWSARPFNKCGGMIGKYHKKRTHKAERKEGKIDARPLHPICISFHQLFGD